MLQRIMARLLASALRRWPAHLREELAREWAAELHTLGLEPGVRTAVRGWRQLRFAASLAASRPPGGDTVLVHWLRRTSPAGAHAGVLLLAPTLVMVASTAALVPLLLIPFGGVEYTPTTTTLFAIENHVILAGVAMLIGTALARWHLRSRSGRALNVVGCAWATLPVIAGLLVADGLARVNGQVWDGSWFSVIAAGYLVILLPPVAAGVAALSRRRRGLAYLVAGLSAPAVTVATVYMLVLVAPQTPLAAGGDPWWWVPYLYSEPYYSPVYIGAADDRPIGAMLRMLPWFILVAVSLALAYAVRSARPLPAGTAVASTASVDSHHDIPAVAASRWWERVALAGGAYAILAWAVTLTYLTPNIGVQSSWPSRITADRQVLPVQPAGWPEWTTEEGRLWMHEVQLSSITCAALCLLLATAYRGRPLLPALAGAGCLLAANMVVVREGWTDIRLLTWLAGGGLLIGILAWWCSTWLGRRRPNRSPRRLVITIAVTAAFLVPGSFFPRAYIRPELQPPPVLLLVVVGLPTILTALAAMGVLAASRRPTRTPPRRPAWLWPVGLALLPAVGGAAYYQWDAAVLRLTGTGPLDPYLFMGPLLLTVPVAVWTIAAIRGRPATLRRLALHALLLIPLLAASYVVAQAAWQATMVLSRFVLFPMEYAQTYDGVAYVPGAVVLGLLLGYLAAVRLDQPAAQDHIDLGEVGAGNRHIGAGFS